MAGVSTVVLSAAIGAAAFRAVVAVAVPVGGMLVTGVVVVGAPAAGTVVRGMVVGGTLVEGALGAEMVVEGTLDGGSLDGGSLDGGAVVAVDIFWVSRLAWGRLGVAPRPRPRSLACGDAGTGRRRYPAGEKYLLRTTVAPTALGGITSTQPTYIQWSSTKALSIRLHTAVVEGLDLAVQTPVA